MNCPFCNYELQEHRENLSCPLCKKILSRDVWQALIDGKKAQKALVVAREVLQCNNFTDVVNYIDIITEPKEK